ncbi:MULTISPECIES: hypothetical protein [Haloferax]|uniref:Uncharacterized protein n=2 Tax=Haloferax TaxID=2251 RepID=A0A6G1Z3Q3_9EURY|nr:MULTISPECIES: hypothetical protein [Haloferax]KAB1188251.1 hypothetical protein Hfx1149_09490 [Haloferax sp. CBA1149]MRW80934.1 hypothetical protein [Haloferax marinisediminis]
MGEAETSAAALDVEIGGLGGEVTLADLFPPSWVESRCDATSIGEFVDNSGFDVSDQESFESIPTHKWDRYVDTHSEFDDWQSMLSAAVERYVLERAGTTDSDHGVSGTETESVREESAGAQV